MTLELAKSLLGFIAPQIIVDHFDLVSIREFEDYFTLEFEELKELIPSELKGKEINLCGFANKIELHTFPQKGKSCYLHLKRRKWEDRSTGKTYSNNYQFHQEGMKATDELGAFLKKNNRVKANKF